VNAPIHGRALRALRYPAFSALLKSATLYRIGFWMSNIAFQSEVARLSGGSPQMLGALGFFNLIPLFLLGPLGGILADRLDRKAIMVRSQAGIGVAAGVLSALTWNGLADSVWILFGFALTFGCGLAMNSPASHAVTANLVEPPDLSSAVSLNSMSANLSRLVGPALAGVVVSAWGPGPAFGAYSALSLASAALFWRVKVPAYVRSRETAGIVTKLTIGWRHARERPPALRVLSMVALVAFFGSSVMLMWAAYASDALGIHANGFVILVMAMGVGAIVGATVTARRRRPLSLRVIALVACLFGVVVTFLGLTNSTWIAVALAVAFGALNFFVLTALNVLLQALTDENKRGRVMSMYVLCWGGVLPMGALGLGSLGVVVGMGRAVTLAGLVIVGGSALIGFRSSASRAATHEVEGSAETWGQ
jgi:MFS family permease